MLSDLEAPSSPPTANQWLTELSNQMFKKNRPPAISRYVPLIGVTGRAGSGKDTIGTYLAARHGYTQLSYASPIKSALTAMFNLDSAIWDDRERKELPIEWLGKSPRELAQTLGTEWGRATDERLWLKVLQHKLDTADTFARFVVADVRFDNEAEQIHENGGVVVSVVRPSIRKVRAHASEKGVNGKLVDYVIENDNSLEHLYRLVEALLFDLGNGGNA